MTEDLLAVGTNKPFATATYQEVQPKAPRHGQELGLLLPPWNKLPVQ